MKRGRTASARPRPSKRARFAFKPRPAASSRVVNTAIRRIMATGEKKFIDDARNLTSVASTANWTTSNTAAEIGYIYQGAAESQHVGRKVVVTNLRIHGTLSVVPAGAAAVDAFHSVRLMVYIDHQNNKTTQPPGRDDLLQQKDIDPAGLPVTITDVSQALNKYYNLENQGRYTVLYDKIHSFNHSGPEPTVLLYPQERKLNINKVLNVPLEFSGPDGGSANMTDNCFKVALMINATTSATAHYKYFARLRYRDN